MSYIDKGLFFLKDKYLQTVIKSPLVNGKVNKYIHRISPEEEASLNLPIETINLTQSDYDNIVNFKALEPYRKFPFQHRKILEYATSFKIIQKHKEIKSLCDFASGGDSYSKYVRNSLNKNISIYSIDPLNKDSFHDGVQYIKGDTSSISLPENSIDIITCHHSIEHFRGEEDIKAIKELLRILNPGGELIILPVFICNQYAEISNFSKSPHYDKTSKMIRDIFSPFPGWGKYEGFARVYNLEQFRKRILSVIDTEKFKIKLLHVLYENMDVPDLTKNRSLPGFCEKMLVLQITKNN